MIRYPRLHNSRIRVLNGLRFYSQILHSIKNGENVSSSALSKSLADKTLSSEDLEIVHQIIKEQKASAQTINQILAHAIPEDFSLYYTLTRANSSHAWDKHSLHSLIASNPGRAITLWALFEKYGSVADKKVKLAVVEKLVKGEKSEIREGSVDITHDRLERAILLLNQIEHDAAVEDHWEVLLSRASELGALEKLSDLTNVLFFGWVADRIESTEEKEFLALSKIVFDRDPSLLSKECISRALASALLEKSQNLGIDYLTALIDHIEKHQLDLDKKDPKSLLIRLELVKAYGICLGEFNKALEKFHKYQTHEKFGIDLVQARLVQVFCYQAFAKGDKTLLRIAETLVDPDELQVKTLAQVILARGRFDSEDSLKLYNDYIKQVSKDVNETTGRSPTGLLTEALMVASLYDNDREFAQLLFEKAVENKILLNESENAQIKKVFKIYGESYKEHDTWEQAKPRFAEYVLQCLQRS